jgi:hypothetical protein
VLAFAAESGAAVLVGASCHFGRNRRICANASARFFAFSNSMLAGSGKCDRLDVAHSSEIDRCYPGARHAPCAIQQRIATNPVVFEVKSREMEAFSNAQSADARVETTAKMASLRELVVSSGSRDSFLPGLLARLEKSLK